MFLIIMKLIGKLVIEWFLNTNLFLITKFDYTLYNDVQNTGTAQSTKLNFLIDAWPVRDIKKTKQRIHHVTNSRI